MNNTNSPSKIIRTLPPTSLRNYLTGMTAVNIPSPEGSGDWHFHDAFFGSPKMPQQYFVAGVNFPDTHDFFGNEGVFECKSTLMKYGVFAKGGRIQVTEPIGPIYAGNHYRASADLLLEFIKKGEPLSFYSIDDWLSTAEEKQRFWDFIQPFKALGKKNWEMIIEWWQKEMALA